MFKNDFAMAVKYKGNILQEYDRKVRLPFGAEYEVRLINKASKRACCDLLVNGEKISRFILDSGETYDIERFLDGNLYSGKRFQFVSLGDSRVGNRNDIDNGLIEAHFYLEQEPKIREVHHHHDHWYPKPEPHPWPKHPWDKPYDDWPKWKDNWCSVEDHGSTGGFSANLKASVESCNRIVGESINTHNAALKGATVRGKESGQKFREVSGYTFSLTATILKLMIVNGEVKAQGRYCSGCGRKRRHSDKYCSHCGNQY